MIELLAELTVQGIGLGAIYSLVAIGFVLIYKVTGVLNFAQGTIAMLGAYGITVLANDLSLSWPVTLLGLLVFGVVLGLALERFVFRYFVGEPAFSVIIVTLALMGIFEGAVRLIASSSFVAYPDVFKLDWSLSLPPFGTPVSGTFAVAVVLALLSVVAFTAFFRYTVIGQVLRATASNQQAAMALGISIRRATVLAWVMSIVITIVGGILFGISQGGAAISVADVIILVLVAAILGGLDSILGAFVGSLTVGVLDKMGAFYIEPVVGPGFGAVFPVIFLLVVILVRPHGLWGSEHIERL